VITDVPSPVPLAPVQRGSGISLLIGFAVLLSIVQLFMAVSMVPRFAGIFRDLLDGQPIPLLTEITIRYRWVFFAASCACLLGTWLMARGGRRLPSLLILPVFQILIIGFTFIVLFLPLIGITTGVASSPH
jgi:hypothetical protein